MRLFANANYEFIRRRRTAHSASAVVLLLSLLGAVILQFTQGSWLNYGVDFTGGTLLQVRFQESTSVADLRAIVEPVAAGSQITQFGEENEFLIRAPGFSEGQENVAESIIGVLQAEFGEDRFDVVRTEAVGPKIGGELQTKAALAILLSFAGTLLYLAFRFEWRYGVAALVAVMHDIAVTLGVLSLFRLEVSLATVAALLTIVGYSLNDTIVIFDRARENLKKTGRRESLPDILDRSINETLPRTVLTSGTTLATLFALFTLGGETIRDFALILFLGVLVGTYSSIFIASPVLLEITKRWQPKPAGKKGSSPRVRASVTA